MRTHTPVPADRNRLTGVILLVLALLSAVAPLAIDLYLPAFPDLADEFAVSATQVQLTLTAFLAGLTLGQLVFGPLSDRYGRRGPLIIGATLCVAASVLAVFAPGSAVLVAARFLQGLGGAAGMVIGRAIISDLTAGDGAGRAAARAFSLMMIVGGVAPVVGPVVGGALAEPIGWRGILGVVLSLAVIMLVCILVVLRESNPPQRRAELSAQRAAQGAWYKSFSSRQFVCYTMAFGFGFASMMAYISASPFVYQDMMGLNAAQYGLAFGFNALALMGVSAVSARLVRRIDAARLLALGVGIVLVASVVLLLLAVCGAPALTLAVPLFFVVSAQGLILGNATGLALTSVPQAAGGASAILGALQFGLAALVSPLVSMGGEGTAVPLGIVMVCCATVATTAMVVCVSRFPLRASADS
ncbi:multidrug effflux MFS transporter [Gordonia asplenii]|nr:multidrug effflux MFS transporter [Gordonia asplenii]